MSTCPDKDLQSAYFDGEIPAKWREKLETHITSCDSCRERAGRYRQLSGLLRQEIPVFTEEQMKLSYAKLRRKMEERHPAGRFRTVVAGRRGIPALAAAAALVAAVILPVTYMKTGPVQSAEAYPLFASTGAYRQFGNDGVVYGSSPDANTYRLQNNGILVDGNLSSIPSSGAQGAPAVNVNFSAQDIASVDIFRPELSAARNALTIRLTSLNDVPAAVREYLISQGYYEEDAQP